jgi:hypothetical protein
VKKWVMILILISLDHVWKNLGVTIKGDMLINNVAKKLNFGVDVVNVFQ